MKSALAALRLTGEFPPELNSLVDFLTVNGEALEESRLVVSAMPAREHLPRVLLALELSSAESAVKFEPKLRALAAQSLGIEPETAAATRKGKARRNVRAKEQPDAPTFALKRAGRWLYSADAPFTFKQLRGDGANPLAENARFQSVSSRFASEPVFLYLDFALLDRSSRLTYEKAERETKERTGKDKPWKDGDPSSELLEMVQPVPITNDLPAPVESSSPEIKPVESQTPDPAEILREPSEAGKEPAAANTENGQETQPPPHAVTADQTGMLMAMLGSSLWEGGLHTPQALGVAVALEGDAIAVRALVANASGEPLNVVPFISALIAGPQIVPDSPAVASADTDIFVSTSLDWPRIYDAMLAGLNKRGVP
ncbi:MAG: hypothetical protein LC754_01510, partial [Acidobacteria bacterium]|nr:hypothetical protein [Acidobacteriota bacterium]